MVDVQPTRENAGGSGNLEGRATDFVVRIAFLGLFTYWSLELVRPFISVIVWAVLLTAAFFPAYTWLSRRLGGQEAISAFIITVLVFFTIVGPASVLIVSLATSAQQLYASLESGTLRVPPPPPGVQDWPLIGPILTEVWTLASTNIEDAIRRYQQVLLSASGTAVRGLASIGGDFLKFVLSVVISGFLFVPGPRLAKGLRRFAGRLVAPRGAHFVDLAGATIRNVSRGVIGVAVIQSIIAGIVFKFSGVPAAGVLAFAVLLFCIIQIGPAPVTVPVIIWSWMTMTGSGALILTVLLVPVMLLDNILKPLLIAHGLSTPMLVILMGVVGGTVAFGMVGLFLGPIVLAVFYELVVAWVLIEPPVSDRDEP